MNMASPCTARMYRYLWSNGPKECLEFADYTFEEHFGKPIASYPPRAVLWDYIVGRVKKAGVRKWIRFNTPVRMVDYDKKKKKFLVTAHDRPKDMMYDGGVRLRDLRVGPLLDADRAVLPRPRHVQRPRAARP